MKEGRPKWNNSSKPPPVVTRSISPTRRERAKLPESSSEDEPFVITADGAQIRSRRFPKGLTPQPGVIVPTLDAGRNAKPVRSGRRTTVSAEETGSRSRSASKLTDLLGQLDSLNSSIADAGEAPREHAPTPTSAWLGNRVSDRPGTGTPQLPGSGRRTNRLLRGSAAGAHAMFGILYQVHMRQLANALRRMYMRPMKVQSKLENPRISELENANRVLEGTTRLVQFMSREQSLKSDFFNRLKMLNWTATGYRVGMLRTSRELRRLMGVSLLTAVVDRVEDRHIYSSLFRLYRNNQYSQLKR